MKNLIYFALNENYLKIFKYSLHSLKKCLPKNTDICCIIPEESNAFDKIDVLKFKIKDLQKEDFHYSIRYMICLWDKFEEYENFIYLDCDTLILDNVQDLFIEIEEKKNKIHACKENESINNSDYHFNFNGTIFEKDCPAFNSGIFGFNKQIKEKLIDFLDFIKTNKKATSKCPNDQPLFNVFFHDYFDESFSKYIELFEMYKPFNPKIVHLLGSIHNPQEKIKRYKRFYRQETRGDILKLMPDESTVGLFNCSNEFIKGPVEYIKQSKKLEIQKDLYDAVDSYYDLIYIDSASNINELTEMIRKLYPKVKKGGIISSALGNEEVNKMVKIFIEKSNLDFFMCFDDTAFFTIKL